MSWQGEIADDAEGKEAQGAMKARWHYGTVALAMLLALAWALGGEEKRPENGGLRLGEKAPDFALPDSNGVIRRLSEFQGKKMVALVFYPALFKAGG